MKPDSILIVGSGALATLFAYRLAAAGIGVTMLCTWPQGLAALRQGGAQVEGLGSSPVQATDDPASCRGAKFALVLVKSWQTERAAHQLAECLADDGLAVTLQNGLGNDALLARSLGLRRVSRGVTTVGATLLSPGLVRPGGEGMVTLEAHRQLSALEGMLRVASFNIDVVADTQPAVWGKLVVNAAINPLTALLRIKNGTLLEFPTARKLMGELAEEAAAVARAVAVQLPFTDPARAAEEVARRTSGNTSSMLQDVMRGAPTEIEAINGALVALGERNGVPLPINRVILSLVKALPINSGKI